jgi:RNA polymerase sigma factor (sigma-70 family)
MRAVRARTCDCRGATASSEGECVIVAPAGRQCVGQPGGEGITGAVGVDNRPRERCGRKIASGVSRPAVRTGGGDVKFGRWVEVAATIRLAGIATAAHERVERHRDLLERLQNSRRRHEHASRPRSPKRVCVAAREVDAVGGCQRLPRQRIGTPRYEPLPDDRDRALAATIDEGDRAALRLVEPGNAKTHALPCELLLRTTAELVSTERREEVRSAGKLHQTDCRHSTTAAGFLEKGLSVDNLARGRQPLHPHELDPFHVPYNRETHGSSLTVRRLTAFAPMMDSVQTPPFERFYAENRDAVFGLLASRLGRQRAEDAFQETFLRALRAYPELRHTENLRGWVLTIAERVAIDAHRRERPAQELAEHESWDSPPPHAQLEHLAAQLPPTERAAVVLRYGYDLDYDQIGAALGSNAQAARQAASSGVRRLRGKELR